MKRESQKAVGIGDACKSMHALTAKLRVVVFSARLSGNDRRARHPFEPINEGTVVRIITSGEHDQVCKRRLNIEWCAQGACRNDEPVANAAFRIDERDSKILRERRILQAVVHDDDGAFRSHALDHFRAFAAIARDDRRRSTGKKQRLVPDVARRMEIGTDAHRTLETSTVTARKKPWLAIVFRDELGNEQSERSLARAMRP